MCHTQLGSGYCADMSPGPACIPGQESLAVVPGGCWVTCCVCLAVLVAEVSGPVRGLGQLRVNTKAPAFVSLQQSALIVQGPQEVKKRELVFLQFRLNQSNEDFSAIDYLLFSSFQEFMQRWLFRAQGSHCLLPCTCPCWKCGGEGREGEQSWPITGATLRTWWPITLSAVEQTWM